MRASGFGITNYKYISSVDSVLANTGTACTLFPCQEDQQVGVVRGVAKWLLFVETASVYLAIFSSKQHLKNPFFIAFRLRVFHLWLELWITSCAQEILMSWPVFTKEIFGY